MKLALFFARRYLFSKKSVNAINIISLISVIGVVVSSAALVIVLSFYNGMEEFILSMNSRFAPELRIEPARGKLFSPDDKRLDEIRDNDSVLSFTEVLEDKTLSEYNGQQYIALLKGMDITEQNIKIYNEMLYSGQFEDLMDSIPYAVIGAQVQAHLQVNYQNPQSRIKLFSPRKTTQGHSINPMDNINVRYIQAVGAMDYEDGFDDLIITPMNFAKDMLSEYEKISAIEIYLRKPEHVNKFQKYLQDKLQEDFIIKNREQQNPILYKTVKSEKWIVFFILTLIGVIAIFNIIGSITMLVLDKREDMLVLSSLGADQSFIQQIFFFEGMIISFAGSLVGILLGYSFAKMQEIYGFVRTNDLENSLLDIYPVDIRSSDLFLVFVTVLIVSTGVSYISSKLSLKGLENKNLKI